MEDIRALTEAVKALAIDLGARKVGVASKAALAGPPEAEVEYVLPGARTAVAFLVVEEEDSILSYLSKVDQRTYCAQHIADFERLIRISLGVAERLRSAGFEAKVLAPNLQYRPGSSVRDELKPPFSHIYAGVAAGLGAIGLGGSMMTPEWGSRVTLCSVVTDAPLVTDDPLETNPCDGCGICLRACPGQFRSLTERTAIRLGGREYEVAKKGKTARCVISCNGFTGRSRDGRWSTWSAGEHAIPDDDGELFELFMRVGLERVARIRGCSEDEVRASLGEDGRDLDRLVIGIFPDPDARNMTCGNCALVCFETLAKRAKALKLLLNSGVVVRGEDGKPRVVGAS